MLNDQFLTVPSFELSLNQDGRMDSEKSVVVPYYGQMEPKTGPKSSKRKVAGRVESVANPQRIPLLQA